MGMGMEENQVCGRNQEFSVESEMFLKHLSQNAKYTDRHTSRAPSYSTCAANFITQRHSVAYPQKWHFLKTLHYDPGYTLDVSLVTAMMRVQILSLKTPNVFQI